MKEQKILAERYALALFKLGEDTNLVDVFLDQLEQCSSMFTTNQELHELFTSPVYDNSQRKAVFCDLAKKLDWHPQIQNFLSLLAEKGRGHVIPEIADSFESLSDLHFGRVHIQVTTATTLSDDFIKQLKDKLHDQTGKEITLHIEEDPSFIGGFSLRMGDKVLDNSLASRLGQMKERLLRQLGQS